MSTKQSSKSDFTGSSSAPSLMDAAEYYKTLSNLLTQGSGFGKTQPVAAFLLRNLRLVTTTESGVDEVTKDIAVEPLYLIMDLKNYPIDYVQKLVVRDIMSKYAARIVGEEDLNSPDFKGPGLWTNKKSSFEGDYVEDPNNKNQYLPNKDAFRICLTVNKPIIIPTSWGDPFTIETGGTLAVRECDVKALSSTLQDIAEGKISPKEALMNEDGSTKFDVYGMNPGFLEKNYQDVELKPATQQSIATLSSAAPQTDRTHDKI